MEDLLRFVAVIGFLATAVTLEGHRRPNRAHPIDTPLPEIPAEVVAEGAEWSVDVILHVSREGSVIRMLSPENADPRIVDACEAALLRWKFDPARRGDEPTDCVFRANISFRNGKFSVGGTSDPAMPANMARILKRINPVYPAGVTYSGEEARVVVEFIVDKRGRIRSPNVLDSPGRPFDRAALEALRKWICAPGSIKGRPVESRLTLTLVSVPENVVRPKLLERVEPVQLPVLPRTDSAGWVNVDLIVDPNGSVRDAKVRRSSNSRFESAAIDAVLKWKFAPETVAGVPTEAKMNYQIYFGVSRQDSAEASERPEI
jgi:TonB family protein